MIRLCMFDMGGVILRQCQVAPHLLAYLGRRETAFNQFSDSVRKMLKFFSRGLVDERDFWQVFEQETGAKVAWDGQSLFGRFFHPVLDLPTVEVVKTLRRQDMRVVCGTNVVAPHYEINKALGFYDIFDHVYASHEMHLAKPDPDFYRYILEKEQVFADQVFFSDDMLDNIEAAESVGLKAFQYSDASHLVLQLGMAL